MVANARWRPDGASVILAGTEPGRSTRLYLQPLAGGNPRPLSEEGVASGLLAVSPDGKLVAAVDPRTGPILYPVDGGDPRRVPETEADDYPIGFGSDGALFVRRHRDNFPARVWRIDLVRRSRTLWVSLTPGQPGATGVGRALMTPDGKSFAFNYASMNSPLYLLEGLE